MIDLYCERQSASLGAEPINALTNLAFLIAALATCQLIRHSARRGSGVWLLPTLMGTVAVGSGLFHTVATPWARVLDVLPILLFQLAYLWFYARRILALGRAGSAVLLGAFLVAALLGRRFPAVLNGSLAYAPGVLVMTALGIHHRAVARREPFALLAAAALLLIAVVFRSVDQVLCQTWPLGTHFLWHLLAALAMYLVSRALVLNWSSGRRRATVEVTAPDPRDARRAGRATLRPDAPAGAPGTPPRAAATRRA